ncbi:nitroreductase [Bradyrhizobium sp. USDA 4524]|uniref:nitroreductase n=1 Tax=unclassified Bradyrhizobium TaxID=2631580 RepID=UPI0020A00952|nr:MULTISPECIES: nitroreductase [unclassified Bradyrhizobium]MCP1840836.1 nitroreductase [Bradyrhizobium sp. USDA 4538]MCP1901399.1 nitroreductase [Bradyrhizobium sp. USDA 4537]MCP1992945.1 nitroreductase [Bradyrhizobium sp. USDA 4539]
MLAREEVVIDRDVACGAARNPIDEVIAGRLSCREFSGSPVSRSTIEQILRVARFAPSGANIQPWHVYVLAGVAKTEVSAALLDAYENEPNEHVSEYQYYASAFPEPYLGRRQEFGRLFYDSLGIAQSDAAARSRQTAKNFMFFGAPVGLIVTIDRRLAMGSWLDLGMFIQNVMLAAVGRGLQSCPQETFARFHRILRPLLSIPAEQMVACGISMGHPRERSRTRLMPRAELEAFASFKGFED